MVKLVHGGDIYSAKERIEGEIVDFSANINPLGLPQSVKETLGNAMDAFSHYPDPICRELVKELRSLADEADFSEEKLSSAGIVKRFQNDDLERCLQEIFREIMKLEGDE